MKTNNCNDTLKYWRVIRRWAQDRHGLSMPELEMLLFLYSEGKFSRTDFAEYEELFSWRRQWFEYLKKRGHIITWRERKGNQKSLYCLSAQTTGIIKSIYRKLNKEEAISEFRGKMNSSKRSYSDKVYRNYIKKINQELRQRQSRE